MPLGNVTTKPTVISIGAKGAGETL